MKFPLFNNLIIKNYFVAFQRCELQTHEQFSGRFVLLFIMSLVFFRQNQTKRRKACKVCNTSQLLRAEFLMNFVPSSESPAVA